jgi:hypothetical protein
MITPTFVCPCCQARLTAKLCLVLRNNSEGLAELQVNGVSALLLERPLPSHSGPTPEAQRALESNRHWERERRRKDFTRDAGRHEP